MRFMYLSNSSLSESIYEQPPPPPAPKLTGTVPGLLDATQPQRLLRSPRSKLLFVSFDPLTASLGRHPQREGSDFRPGRIVVETTSSGQSTWRFVPRAQFEEGVTDEGDWPRVVDVCGIRFELSQEQWEIYKLDPNYHCIVREPPHIPIIVPCTTDTKMNMNAKTASNSVDQHHHHQATKPPSPTTGDKRRVPSPAEDSEGATNTTPTSPVPPKKRPHIPTSAPVWVETETESEESEVEGMIVDDDEQFQSQSQGQSQSHGSQSRERARNAKERVRVRRRERQQRTARRTEWLSNHENVGSVPTWNPNVKEYSMLDGTFESASISPAPSIGKRKAPSTSDNTPRATNEASYHAANGHAYSGSSRNAANYASSGAKRARTVSPSSKKSGLWHYKQQRDKQKAGWRRMQQEERAKAREAEVWDELFRGNNTNTSHGYHVNEQNHVNRCDTVEMLSVHSDIGPEEDQEEHENGENGVSSGQERASSSNASANLKPASAPTTPTANNLDSNPNADNDVADAERQARIAESRRKLAELEADRPLWQRVAAERRARERREEEQKKAEQARRRAEAEKAERERNKKEEEARQKRSREEAARKYAEQEERARQQKQRARRQRDSTRHGPWTVERAKQRYNDLSEKFDGMKFGRDLRKGEIPLTAYDIPWPMLQREYDLADVNWQTVSEFFDAVRPTMKAMEFKKMIIKSHVRFHTDRWASRRLLESIDDDAERECIEIANKMVIQQLTPIWEEVCGKKVQD